MPSKNYSANNAPDKAVTNTQFIHTLFPRDQLLLNAVPMVCGFPDDPNEPRRGKWTAHPVTRDTLPYPVSGNKVNVNNTFFSISSFIAIDGRYHRRIANFAACHVLVLDDIGTGLGAKIDQGKIKLAPTYVIETSPDNYQLGYALAEPMTDAAEVLQLQQALISQGLLSEKDPGMANVTRVMRLPDGVNTKKKYGKPFPHVLHDWTPARKYTVDDIVKAYGLDLSRIPKVTHNRAAVHVTRDDDPFLKVLSGLGLIKSNGMNKDSTTVFEMTCPWVDEHSDAADTGAAYFLGGGFKCHHGHCENKRFADVKRWLKTAHGIDTETLSLHLKRGNQLSNAEVMRLVIRRWGAA